ncbi:MAG: hypothetical protein KJ060_19945, partial [Candidatus Hydrogenedentes bacterium]|nr:hypothetical protein [Candidatus Hydrogenedentota bacterium]
MSRLLRIFLIMCLAVSFLAVAEVPYPEALDRAAVTLATLDDPINDALLIGNGDLNALVFAEGDDIVIRITKNDVWDARLESALDPPIPTLERLKELGTVGPWEDRTLILPEGSTWEKPDSYHANPYPCPRACGVLRIADAAAPPLVAKLDLRRARIAIHSASGDYRVLIPAESNQIVVARSKGALAASLEAIASEGIPAAETGTEEGVVWVTQDIPGDLDWPGMSFAVAMAQHEGTAAVSVVTSLESETPKRLAMTSAHQAVQPAPTANPGSHESIWADFWSKSGISIDDPVLERVWYRNLYFLRCVSKPGVVSTGLFAGLLDDKPAWHGDYHTNYNIQQTYWLAYAANQCELTEPYDRLITEYLPRARWMARTIFDMDGAYIPHVLFAYEPPDPAACKSPGGRQYIHHEWGFTQGVNGFSVQPLWWHYKYDPDPAFLRDVAYPAVRDVADFQADFVDQCERDGDHVVLAPSVSPEHWGWKENFERNRNCTFDIAIFRYIFNAAIEGATTLGVDAEKVEEWRAAEALLPDYPVWSDDPNIVVDVEDAPPIEYNIPVPTTPVFPGDVVTFASPEAERALFTNTLQHLQHNGNNAPVMLAVTRARLSTADAHEFLRTELMWRERRNGTLSFNRLDPRFRFNDFGHYTEMFGAALPVMELLLQSVGDVVRVFPAWPSHIPATFEDLRTQGGFLVTATIAEGNVSELRVTSTIGGTLRIAL